MNRSDAVLLCSVRARVSLRCPQDRIFREWGGRGSGYKRMIDGGASASPSAGHSTELMRYGGGGIRWAVGSAFYHICRRVVSPRTRALGTAQCESCPCRDLNSVPPRQASSAMTAEPSNLVLCAHRGMDKESDMDALPPSCSGGRRDSGSSSPFLLVRLFAGAFMTI